MSLLSWLFPKQKRPTPAPAGRNAPAAVPAAGASPAGAAVRAAPPVDERMQRREQLYGVVRDVMVRAGILSAGYKFKVLSLDQRGAQFLVMVDMAPEYAGEPLRGVEIETLIVQTARVRCDILVTAVYWRINPQLAMHLAQRPGRGVQPAAVVVPAPPPPPAAPPPAHAGEREQDAAPSRPAPLVRPPHPPGPGLPAAGLAPAARPAGRFDPIEADEVAAFRKALATAAASRPAGLPAEPGATTRSGPLLPRASGFEDTLMPDQEPHKADLSSTQYGSL